jgi:hypothetical protein
MSNSSNTTNTNLNINQTEEINIFKSLKTKKTNEPINLKEDTKKKLSTLDTKSKMIRYLNKEGYTTHQISKILSIRYQHVYNVLHQVLKN